MTNRSSEVAFRLQSQLIIAVFRPVDRIASRSLSAVQTTSTVVPPLRAHAVGLEIRRDNMSARSKSVISFGCGAILLDNGFHWHIGACSHLVPGGDLLLDVADLFVGI